MKKETAFIYTLSDPRTGALRYVGKTFNMHERLKGHCHETRVTHCMRWVKSILKRGDRPIMELLEELPDCTPEEWEAAEQFWISYLKFLGFHLVNLQSGGISGKRLALETREKLRHAHLGKRLTPEHRAKVSAALTGRIVTPQTRAKIAAKHRGRTHSPEHVANLAVARRGLKHSAETRLKMSMARAGKKKSASQIENWRKAVTGRKCTPEQVERIRQGAIRGNQSRKLHAHQLLRSQQIFLPLSKTL